MPIGRGLMKSDLRGTPAIEPEFSLHALGFLGRLIGLQVILRASGFTGNLVSLSQPSTQIDQPAAVAAKWTKLRSLRPFDVAPASGTFHFRSHRSGGLLV